ncbi:MAG: DUF6638 family protein [bacterium]
MDKLIAANLFGDQLARIDSPELVGRYNECLKAIGLEPTKLEAFSVDGIGWSPQIAQERKRIKYFSMGTAAQFGIILTPAQKGLPIFTPINSFDRLIMEKYFRNFGKHVSDLTSRTGLWLDFSHDLLEFQSPLDLLMVDSVVVRSADVDGLMEAARQQRELDRQFRRAEKAWQDDSLMKKICDSAEKYGDLRFRAMIIPDLPFSDLRCFVTQAFGGVYVFRDTPKNGPLLVTVDDQYKPMSEDTATVYHASDKELPAVLLKEGITDVPLGWYKNHLSALEEIRDFHIVDAYYKAGNGDVEFQNLTSAQLKQWIAGNLPALPVWFSELGRLIAQLRQKTSVKTIKISHELSSILMRPSHQVAESLGAEEVTLQLLARLDPTDVERLYVHNKILFYDLYRGWSEGKKKWCIDYLTSRGHPRHINAEKDKK